MNEDAQFSCTACHIEVDEDAKETMTACRACGRIHCHSCIDEHGRCVECTEDDVKETK